MSNAKLLIDYLGNGVQQEVFHPTIPVSCVQGIIQLPLINEKDGNGTSWYDFSVPVDNPFLIFSGFPAQRWDKGIDAADTYFENLGGRNWRLHIIGRQSTNNYSGLPQKQYEYDLPFNRDHIPARPVQDYEPPGTKPLPRIPMKGVCEAYIYWGVVRG